MKEFGVPKIADENLPELRKPGKGEGIIASAVAAVGSTIGLTLICLYGDGYWAVSAGIMFFTSALASGLWAVGNGLGALLRQKAQNATSDIEKREMRYVQYIKEEDKKNLKVSFLNSNSNKIRLAAWSKLLEGPDGRTRPEAKLIKSNATLLINNGYGQHGKETFEDLLQISSSITQTHAWLRTHKSNNHLITKMLGGITTNAPTGRVNTFMVLKNRYQETVDNLENLLNAEAGTLSEEVIKNIQESKTNFDLKVEAVSKINASHARGRAKQKKLIVDLEDDCMQLENLLETLTEAFVTKKESFLEEATLSVNSYLKAEKRLNGVVDELKA